MAATAILCLVLLGQDPARLEAGQVVQGFVVEDAAAVHTPALDANYTRAPTLGVSYSIQLPEGGACTVELRSHDFDAYLVLTDTDGNLVAEDDDGLVGTHARLVHELKAEQEYRVIACALHGRRGEFQLSLDRGLPAEIPESEPWQIEAQDLRDRIRHLQAGPVERDLFMATTMNQLAALLFQHAGYAEARSLFERALVIREERLEPSHPAIAQSMNNLAVLLKDQGHNSEAQELYQRAIKIRAEALGPDHPATATSLSNLAMLLQDQGNFQEARPLHQRALAIQEKALGADHPATAITLNNLAFLYESEGDYAQARLLYHRALAIYQSNLGSDHPRTASVLNNLAFLHKLQGRYEEARPLYERVLAAFEQTLGPEHPNTAMALNNLGSLLKIQGNFLEALPLFERALAISTDVLGPEHPNTAITMSNLASVHQNLGHFSQARPLFERALEINSKVLGARHPNTATAQHNLALLHYSSGDYQEARPLYEQSLAIREAVLGPNHPETANNLNGLGSLLQELGEYQEAQVHLERALDSFSRVQGPQHPDTVVALQNLAALFANQGRYAEALPLVRRAVRASLAHLQQELPTLSEAERLRFLRVSADPEKLLVCLAHSPAPDRTQEYALFQQWKGMATRMQAAGIRLGQEGVSPARRSVQNRIQIHSKELSRLVLQPLAEQTEDHALRLAALRDERMRLERELNRDLGLDALLATPQLLQVQAGMPKASVLVDFFVGGEVYAWVLDPQGGPQLIPLGSTESLRSAAETFLRTTALRGGRSLDPGAGDPNAELMAKLWQPLREAVGDAGIVFLCPDDFLCELPFGILHQADHIYLLEKHRFVYLSDPTRLAREMDSLDRAEGAILAIGGIDYFQRAEASADAASRSGAAKDEAPKSDLRSRVGGSWDSLPATKIEIQSLRDLHDKVLEWPSPLTVVEDKAATEERIREEIPGHRYVHIATHGYFEPDHLPSLLLDAEEKQAKAQLGEQIRAVGLLPGLLSGLVFAGVNAEPDPTRDDGYLSAEEIQHLDLSACDLVVLSACETALGSARAGEGLMSMRRAFAVAGADTVVSSLWKVEDQATAQLMKDFYTNLWTKGMTRSASLHQARLRMLRRNRLESGDDARPSTWGAFVLSGEWR